MRPPNIGAALFIATTVLDLAGCGADLTNHRQDPPTVVIDQVEPERGLENPQKTNTCPDINTLRASCSRRIRTTSTPVPLCQETSGETHSDLADFSRCTEAFASYASCEAALYNSAFQDVYKIARFHQYSLNTDISSRIGDLRSYHCDSAMQENLSLQFSKLVTRWTSVQIKIMERDPSLE